MNTYFIYFWFKNGHSKSFEIASQFYNDNGFIVLSKNFDDFCPLIYINISEIEYFISARTEVELLELIPV